MKQVLINSKGAVPLEVPAPLVEAGHLLVGVGYSLISSGTEISTLRGARQSLVQKAMRQPQKAAGLLAYLEKNGLHKTIAKINGKMADLSPLGYACAGTVVQVGAGVDDFQVGDRVACAGAGKANHAEWVLVPRHLAVPIPAQVSLKAAASTTLGAIAMQGVRRADLRLGEWAAVFGLGLLGQISVQLLRSAGIQVAGFDVDARRVAKARELGLAYAYTAGEDDPVKVIFELSQGHGVDAALLTAATNSNVLINQAAEVTRLRGRIVVVGAVGMGLNRSPFYEKEQDLLIARSYGPGRYDTAYEEKGLEYPYAYVRWSENRNMQEYVRLLADGSVRFEPLVEKIYPVGQAAQAYQDLEGESPPLAVLLEYPASIEGSMPESKPVRLRRSSSNGKINVALVGAGNFGRAVHLPNLARLKDIYHLRAVVSRNASQAMNAASQFGADYLTADLADVLSDPSVDAVMICTRHDQHVRQARTAAQAGKAVFLEKPMALDGSGLQELAKTIEETQVPFMVGFNRRFSPALRRAREVLQDTSPLMILYRVNAGYIPSDHWTQTEAGGGRIVGEACHMLDACKYLVGGSPVIGLEAAGIVSKLEHRSGQDNRSIHLRYRDGSVADIFYTALGDPALEKERIEIYAAGKVFIVDDFNSLRIYGAKMKGWQSASQDKGHLEELRAFARYVRGEIPPPISLEDLVETTRLSIQAAGREG